MQWLSPVYFEHNPRQWAAHFASSVSHQQHPSALVIVAETRMTMRRRWPHKTSRVGVWEDCGTLLWKMELAGEKDCTAREGHWLRHALKFDYPQALRSARLSTGDDDGHQTTVDRRPDFRHLLHNLWRSFRWQVAVQCYYGPSGQGNYRGI